MIPNIRTNLNSIFNVDKLEFGKDVYGEEFKEGHIAVANLKTDIITSYNTIIKSLPDDNHVLLDETRNYTDDQIKTISDELNSKLKDDITNIKNVLNEFDTHVHNSIEVFIQSIPTIVNGVTRNRDELIDSINVYLWKILNGKNKYNDKLTLDELRKCIAELGHHQNNIKIQAETKLIQLIKNVIKGEMVNILAGINRLHNKVDSTPYTIKDILS